MKNCIIMQDSIIGENVIMDNVIADRGTIVHEDKVIMGTDNYPVTIQRRRVDKAYIFTIIYI